MLFYDQKLRVHYRKMDDAAVINGRDVVRCGLPVHQHLALQRLPTLSDSLSRSERILIANPALRQSDPNPTRPSAQLSQPSDV